MGNIPYTKSVGSIAKFLAQIQSLGVPDKVTIKYLKSIGFTSSNDSYLVGLFKGINFLDSSGTPTELWRAYRDKSRSRTVLAEGVRQGYPELFQTYPDAYRRDDEALTNFIRTHTDFSGDTVARAVGTFKALCSLADFEGDPPGEVTTAPESPAATSPARQPVPPVLSHASPTVNVNIQLQLPASEDGKIYDEFFAAMKKHLFSDA